MTTQQDALRNALEELSKALLYVSIGGEPHITAAKRAVEQALAAQPEQLEQPVATLLIGGVDSRGELSENDIDLHMRAIEALQVALVAHGAVDGAKIQLFTSPQVRAEQTAVSPGWKLVPIEATTEMCTAGYHQAEPAKAYRAMLSVAPQPPQENKT
jgi:hypothetical protein